MEFRMKACLKQTAAAVTALTLALGAVPAGAEISGVPVPAAVVASAAEPGINSKDVTIYAVSEAFKDSLRIPSKYHQTYKLKVTGADAEDVTFETVDSFYINCSDEGVISVNNLYFGDFSVSCTVGEKKFDVKVHVKDYGAVYTEEVLDKFVKDNITDKMTVAEKLEAIAKYVSGKNYDRDIQSVQGMIITGGGDSLAASNTVIALAKKIGLDGWTRDCFRDENASEDHVDAMIADGEKYYEVDAGKSDKNSRSYTVKERLSLFSTRPNEELEGVEVYQYDGKEMPEVLEIPSQIGEKPVVSVGSSAFCYVIGLKRIVIPETVKSIGYDAFFGIKELESVVLPASVVHIDDNPFGCCNRLSEIECAEGSAYSFADGVLYTGGGTVIVSAPSASTVNIGSGVKEIGAHAFWGNKQIKRVVIPATVEKLGDLPFGYAENLRSIMIEEGCEAALPPGLAYKTGVSELFVPESITEEYIPKELEELYEGTDSGISAFYDDYNVTDIIGFTGSFAEQFAEKYGFKFVETDKKSRVIGASIQLGGNIGVNIYLKPSMDRVSRGAYAVITGPNDTDGGEMYVFRDNDADDGVYKLSGSVNAGQMNERITVRVYNADGTPITLTNEDGSSTYMNAYTYSVRDYIDAVESPSFSCGSEEETKKIKELVNSIKVYGVCAKKFFDKEMGIKAEENPITDNDYDLSDVIETALRNKGYEAVIKKSSDELKATYGYTLILRSETTLRLYYNLPDRRISSVTVKNKDNTDVKNVRFGETVDANGKPIMYAEIPDIPAAELGTSYEMMITTEDGEFLSINASPISYVCAVLKNYGGKAEGRELCDVSRALYKYFANTAEYLK
ncbi:MAG: leucine-rich repeat domain-containing protein [Ruminococcus sp.]|nr:leucine-rich repeat domain-containing protein [Ruminococcus sp.]